MARTSSRRPLSRGEKWLFFGCPLLLLGVVSVTLLDMAREAMPVIVFPKSVPLPKPNGYDRFVLAAQTVKPTNPAINSSWMPGTLALQLSPLQAERYILSRNQMWLKANATGLGIFQRALKMPCVAPNVRDLQSNAAVRAASFNWTPLTSVLETRIITLGMKGKWSATTQAALDVIQMGTDLARGAELDSKKHTDRIIGIGWRSLDRQFDAPSHLNVREARNAVTRLEGIIAHAPSFAQAAEESRWADLNKFQQIAKNPNWRQIAYGSLSYLSWKQRVEIQLRTKRDIVQGINELYDSGIANLKLPYSSIPVLHRPTSTSYLNFLSSSIINADQLPESQGENVVGMQLLLLRFALRAYQAEHGVFPSRLEQLLPTYLKRMPTDYYARNRPFHYQKTATGYMIWSVGSDGVNNGAPLLESRIGRKGMVDSDGEWRVIFK